MRHLWSLIAGILVAPLAWLLLAIGQSNAEQRITRWEQAGFFDTANLVAPAVFLVAAGLLLGVLGTLRWSPAGPMVAGALLVLPTVFMFANPFRTLEFFGYDQPRRIFWQDFQPWLPAANGTLLVLGSLLLVATVSAQRWRRWPVAPTPLPAATDEEVIAGVGQLARPSGPTSPMSDDEILAAAAAIDEELDRTGRRPPPPSAPSAPLPIEWQEPTGRQEPTSGQEPAGSQGPVGGQEPPDAARPGPGG